MSATVYIGTSGWNYPHWKPRFYQDIPKTQWLTYYASRFNAIEVNSTFYRLQTNQTFEHWYQQTPGNFRFTIKGNRYLTHTKRLNNPQDSIQLEQQHAQHLKEKLAVVLWQLPGNFSLNFSRLNIFIDALQMWNSVRHTVEFRHSSWFESEVAELLRHNNIAVCQSDAGDWPIWREVTADFVYLRLHGNPTTYVSNYSRAKLAKLASEIRTWLKQGLDVHVYFDNDADARAPLNALSLRKLISD
ncbi:DUF72 domain-containing protein [Kaarinaea lacus]